MVLVPKKPHQPTATSDEWHICGTNDQQIRHGTELRKDLHLAKRGAGKATFMAGTGWLHLMKVMKHKLKHQIQQMLKNVK